MALLAQITAAQAAALTGQQYEDGSYFNPIQIGEEWYISAEEVRDCVNHEFAWVKDLEVTDLELPPQTVENPHTPENETH
jgi:hypothetical protein